MVGAGILVQHEMGDAPVLAAETPSLAVETLSIPSIAAEALSVATGTISLTIGADSIFGGGCTTTDYQTDNADGLRGELTNYTSEPTCKNDNDHELINYL